MPGRAPRRASRCGPAGRADWGGRGGRRHRLRHGHGTRGQRDVVQEHGRAAAHAVVIHVEVELDGLAAPRAEIERRLVPQPAVVVRPPRLPLDGRPIRVEDHQLHVVGRCGRLRDGVEPERNGGPGSARWDGHRLARRRKALYVRAAGDTHLERMRAGMGRIRNHLGRHGAGPELPGPGGLEPTIGNQLGAFTRGTRGSGRPGRHGGRVPRQAERCQGRDQCEHCDDQQGQDQAREVIHLESTL